MVAAAIINSRKSVELLAVGHFPQHCEECIYDALQGLEDLESEVSALISEKPESQGLAVAYQYFLLVCR